MKYDLFIGFRKVPEGLKKVLEAHGFIRNEQRRSGEGMDIDTDYLWYSEDRSGSCGVLFRYNGMSFDNECLI